MELNGQELKLGDATRCRSTARPCAGLRQIRLSAGSETWLISGDVPTDDDPSCAPFEAGARRCVESPRPPLAYLIYRWQPAEKVAAEILEAGGGPPGAAIALSPYALAKGAGGCCGTGGPGSARGGAAALAPCQTLMPLSDTQGIVLQLDATPLVSCRSESLAGRLVIAPPSAHHVGVG